MFHIKIGMLSKMRTYTVEWWTWAGKPDLQHCNCRHSRRDAHRGESSSSFIMSYCFVGIALPVEVHFSNTLFPLTQNTHGSQDHLILVITTVYPEACQGTCHLLWTFSRGEVIPCVWGAIAHELLTARRACECHPWKNAEKWKHLLSCRKLQINPSL